MARRCDRNGIWIDRLGWPWLAKSPERLKEVDDDILAGISKSMLSAVLTVVGRSHS